MARDIKYLVLALAMAATAGAIAPPSLRGVKDASGADTLVPADDLADALNQIEEIPWYGRTSERNERPATKAQLAEKAAEVASQLRLALEKANMRTTELFRDWDADGSGAIDRKEFTTAMLGLNVRATKEELDAIFDKWDTDGSGALDFKELDFAIKGAKRTQLSKATSSKEIQKALREKLQGTRKAPPAAGASKLKAVTTTAMCSSTCMCMCMVRRGHRQSF